MIHWRVIDNPGYIIKILQKGKADFQNCSWFSHDMTQQPILVPRDEGNACFNPEINSSRTSVDPTHKWLLIYICSVIVQIGLPSLALEQEFFSI